MNAFNEVIAIVGTETWSLIQAKKKLKIDFETVETLESSDYHEDKLNDALKNGTVNEQRMDGNPEEAFKNASKIIEETPDLSSCMTLVCPDHLKKAKPSPEGILLACNQLNLNPKEVIYFGDHQKDLMASRAAGTLTAACTYGYALKSSDLENDDIEVRNLLEFSKTNFKSLDEHA